MLQREFNIEIQFADYLNRVYPGKLLPMQQMIEIKRAFYGAWGMLLVVLRDNIGEMEENEALDALEAMQNQIEAFWTSQSRK